MKIDDAKAKFIQAWGVLGTSWGISRTMAQIHALLLVSADPLSAQEIIDTLSVSQGSANMNLRALIDWQLIEKTVKIGERKEYFAAEKNMWEITKRVMRERRKRELEPILKMLEDVRNIELLGKDKKEVETSEVIEQKNKEIAEFKEMMEQIDLFANRAEKALEVMIKASESKIVERFLK
jgi:DNA-binding transcriptional regulator GbsR (MarR family)